MRGRTLTLLALAAVAAAVWLSMRTEERFAVDGLRLEADPAGQRVAGEVRTTGGSAALVKVEVTTIAPGGGRPSTETIELRGVGPDAPVPFRSAPHPGGIGSWSVRVDEGRNPYGN